MKLYLCVLEYVYFNTRDKRQEKVKQCKEFFILKI